MVTCGAVFLTTGWAIFLLRKFSQRKELKLAEEPVQRFEQAVATLVFTPLIGAILTQSIALSRPELGFAHLRVILDPASMAVITAILPAVIDPGFFIRWPLLLVLSFVSLFLLLPIGIRYENALVKSIQDFPDCIDESLLEGCKPWELGFYALLVGFFFMTLILNAVQYFSARRRAAKQTSSIGDVLKIRQPKTGYFVLLVVVFAFVVAFVSVEMVLVFTDRAAFLPLINPDELKLEFGQYAALTAAIISVLLAFAQVLGVPLQLL